MSLADHDDAIISTARNSALIRIPETRRLIVHRPSVPRMNILAMLHFARPKSAVFYHVNQ